MFHGRNHRTVDSFFLPTCACEDETGGCWKKACNRGTVNKKNVLLFVTSDLKKQLLNQWAFCETRQFIWSPLCHSTMIQQLISSGDVTFLWAVVSFGGWHGVLKIKAVTNSISLHSYFHMRSKRSCTVSSVPRKRYPAVKTVHIWGKHGTRAGVKTTTLL